MTKTQIPTIFTVCSSFIFFMNSFGQIPIDKRVKNKSLPKEIKLNPKTIKITDSVFMYEKGLRKLQWVQVFDLKNGIIVSGKTKYFVNDTLSMTTDEKYNSNGNIIESNTFSHFKKSRKIVERTLDEYGNITLLKVTENNRINIIEYQNNYKENKLVEVSVVSKKSGNTIKKTTFKYDKKGNLIEERIVGSFSNTKSIYQYNKSNQVIVHKHFINAALNDSISYYYDKGLLVKEEWYHKLSTNPMVKKYYYNERGAVILIENEDGYKTEYKKFDSFLNWQIRQTYGYSNIITALTKRHFINR